MKLHDQLLRDRFTTTPAPPMYHLRSTVTPNHAPPKPTSMTSSLHGSRRSIVVAWRDSAACLDVAPELFFPVGTAYPALLQIAEAKKVCGRCPVIETCLQWATEAHQDSGVWGGLSSDERRTLKRRKARAASLAAASAI